MAFLALAEKSVSLVNLRRFERLPFLGAWLQDQAWYRRKLGGTWILCYVHYGVPGGPFAWWYHNCTPIYLLHYNIVEVEDYPPEVAMTFKPTDKVLALNSQGMPYHRGEPAEVLKIIRDQALIRYPTPRLVGENIDEAVWWPVSQLRAWKGETEVKS